MAPDERNPDPEKSFEKALARHFRSLAPSREAAGLRPDSFPQTALCPDAETLAAYHERSLLPGELNSWKEHIGGCPHCQQILAQLEATDGIPLQAAEAEEIPPMMESEPAAASRSLEPFSSGAPAGSARPGAEAALPEKPRSARLSSGVRWRWLAPAGALAAGLLVWIAIHEKQPGFPGPSEIQMAKRQEPPAPSPPALRQPSTPPPQVLYSQNKPQASADEPVASNGRTAAESAKQREKPDLQAETRARSSRTPADKESGERKDEQRDASLAPFRDANQTDLDSKKAATGAAQQNAEISAEMKAAQEQAANAPLQNRQNQYAPNAQNVPGPAPLNQAPPAKKMKAAPAAAAPAGAAGLRAATSMLQTVNVSNSHVIAVPGSNIIWRVGRNGLIEFSTDKGASWSRQTSGVPVDLLAGFAPSEKVCWIVGRAGTILLTTDGGAHWKLLSSPLEEDLGGVVAADAAHATIWNAQNTKSFETSDGGLTWKLLPAP